MADIVLAQATQLAKTLGVEGDAQELVETLKATAFKGNVSDAQMTALLLVANKYGLSPWTKEIYAFPDRQNGIVPVVGVDGWSRIINQHPQFDGVEFEQSGESCTCRIYRKDRAHPTTITEFMKECSRGTGPWQTHPRRMLRHKAFIQCARIAFGYSGIYDDDEASRIAEAREADDDGVIDVPARPSRPAAKAAAPAFDLAGALAEIAAAPTPLALTNVARAYWKAAPEDAREQIHAARNKRAAELEAAEQPAQPEEQAQEG